jgi:plastocyanin
MRTSVPALAAAAALLAAALTGCSSASSSSEGTSSSPSGSAGGADGPVIELSRLMYMPKTMEIKAGTTVTWTNAEPISHTVTSGMPTGVDAETSLRSGEEPDGTFDEELPEEGDSFSFTYDEPGTYAYYCDIHKGMNAEIVVTP